MIFIFIFIFLSPPTFSFALSFLSKPPRALIIHTIQYNSYKSYTLTIHSISVHQLHFYAPSPLRERDTERERREREKDLSRRDNIFILFSPPSLHFISPPGLLEKKKLLPQASRPAPLTSTESYANAYFLKSKSTHRERKKERKRAKDTLLSNSKSSAIFVQIKILSIYISLQTNQSHRDGWGNPGCRLASYHYYHYYHYYSLVGPSN